MAPAKQSKELSAAVNPLRWVSYRESGGAMPRRPWTLTCEKTDTTRTELEPFRCWRCLRPAQIGDWRRSVVEMVGDYQRFYRLQCLGPVPA